MKSEDLYTKVANKFNIPRSEVKLAAYFFLYSGLGVHEKNVESTIVMACIATGLIKPEDFEKK